MRALGIVSMLLALAVVAYLASRQLQGHGGGPSAVLAAHDEARARDAMAQVDVVRVTEAVTRYRAEKAALPANLDELKSAGMLGDVPADVAYDPATGRVTPKVLTAP